MDKILPFHLSDLTSTSVWGDMSLLVSAQSLMDSSRQNARAFFTLLQPFECGGMAGREKQDASCQHLVPDGRMLACIFSSSELDFSSQNRQIEKMQTNPLQSIRRIP